MPESPLTALTPPPPHRPAANQSALMELLEVPQLMDTCVRNGVYDEALDLQAFVSRVGLLHPDVPVVKLLLRQVRAPEGGAGQGARGRGGAGRLGVGCKYQPKVNQTKPSGGMGRLGGELIAAVARGPMVAATAWWWREWGGPGRAAESM